MELNSSLPYINSGTICDYVKTQLAAGHKHGSFFAISISDAPTTGSGQNFFVEYQAYDGTGNIRLFAQHITNRTMYISNMYNTDSALTSWSKYAAQSAVDELNSKIAPVIQLTYDSSISRFVPPSGTAKLANAQLTFVARNINTGAIYVLYYIYSENTFAVIATISGSAPSNGNLVQIMAVR